MTSDSGVETKILDAWKLSSGWLLELMCGRPSPSAKLTRALNVVGGLILRGVA